MSYLLTTQTQYQKLKTVTAIDDAATLPVTARTNQDFFDTYQADSMQFTRLAGGVIVAIELTADANTCEFELWGHPEKGDLELIGSFTCVAGKQATGDGGYWADTIVVTDGAYDCTGYDNAGNDRKAIIQFDGKGLSDVYPWVTAISASTTVSFWARTY